MISRRRFLRSGTLSGIFAAPVVNGGLLGRLSSPAPTRPIVISTWNHGIPANEAAWKVLSKGGWALDAVEAGVRIPEADPNVTSVGYGGLPDREGHVTLDACLMDEAGNCGSVAFLEHIMHPISVARMVMEKTPHIMLVGEGALEFALAHGFEKQNLLTPESEAAWREWLKNAPAEVKAEINVENHDTIGMLALDAQGNLSGACTTSGTAWKLHGRVGDSPIIGAGLFVDGEVGGATSTGWGEAVIRTAGSHTVVELMRQGRSPEDACRETVERVIRKNPDYKEIQVGFLALNRDGAYGSYCIQPGFDFAVYDQPGGNRLLKSPSAL
ncbi:MAG TPA: N(4)-(beta-N-acetylglucosaminyl)-L-asparaginase [Rhodothermales bacterium]|nr:N(4)-(beta-N-acetylglucosaminyl)-L-asparaginase [Rhodothermales bacterium]